ncbi:MAG TPA: MoaD/ThiS family protein [Gaiellaceae bacterium]|nr:MoaD/ThiS family protein [Gaiellaceae bacterium]
MADVHLPMTLTPLFPGLPRKLEVDAPTVVGVIDELDARFPGLRDRLLELGRPTIRQHIHVYVDRERAGLDTPLETRSRVDVIAAISGG